MYARRLIFPAPATATPRTARTARRILDVFLLLLADKSFDRISAVEIADACEIARSTVYRHFATTSEILWAAASPHLSKMVRAAVRGDGAAFATRAEGLWAIPNLVPALAGGSSAELKAKFAVLAAAEIELAAGQKDATVLGLVLAGAWFEYLRLRTTSQPSEQELGEIMTVIFVSAFLTPEAVRSRDRQHLSHRAFPAAVSARESLASRDHIISMIDGRPYRSLTRHIARFGMNAADYRACFGLDESYPMVAPGYSDRRRAIARSLPIASRRQGPVADPTTPPL